MRGSDRPLVLVVGIGNPDRGDDGVGPVIVRRLKGRVPADVRILECGGDALTLLDEWEGFASVILVDAVAPIDRPGRVATLSVHQSSIDKPPESYQFL